MGRDDSLYITNKLFCRQYVAVGKGEDNMAKGARISKYMEILEEYDEVNSSWNWGILDELSDEELLDKNKVAEKINIIRKHQTRLKNNPNKYPENVMEYVRQRWGLEKYDTSRDEEINQLSPDEIFNYVCDWNGLVGYAYTIKTWIADIYGIDLEQNR